MSLPHMVGMFWSLDEGDREAVGTSVTRPVVAVECVRGKEGWVANNE